MFNVTVYFNEDDFGGQAGTVLTCYSSLGEDTAALLDEYRGMAFGSEADRPQAMECEVCGTTVLVIERGAMGSEIITEFRPFGVDDDINGSGVVQCAPCILQSAAHGQVVIGRGEGGRGVHRAA